MNCELLNRWMTRGAWAAGIFAAGAFIYQQAPKVVDSPGALGIVAILGVLAIALTLQHRDFV